MTKELKEKIEEIRGYITRANLLNALSALTDAVEILGKQEITPAASAPPPAKKPVAKKLPQRLE